MANSDYSKIKILFLYDFFMTRLNAFDEDSSVSMAELLDFLEKETGTRFERKSVYSDIKRLNDFMRKTGRIKTGKNDEWIFKDKKRYKVSELETQISKDEAMLLVDAVNTTAFTDSGIADKIKELFPSYFGNKGNSVSLVRRDRKNSQRLTSYLNILRSGIEEKTVINFNYGYKLGNALASRDKRTVSPLALDWENNTYYLIAVDNDICIKKCGGKATESAIRRFRIDRIDGVSLNNAEKYMGFATAAERKAAYDNVIKHSVSAYSADEMVNVEIKIVFDPNGNASPDAIPEKEVLKSFSIIADHVTIKRIINEDKLRHGELVFIAESADAPTFYSYLFQAGTVPGIKLSLQKGPVRDKYITYLENGLNAL